MYFGACWHRAQYGRTGHRRKPGAKYGTKDRNESGASDPIGQTAGFILNTEPQSSRYSLAAAEVLASEQSVLRLITRNTPLPELLVEVCRRAEALLGDGASCTILLLDTDGVHVHVGAAPSLPGRYSAAIEGASIACRRLVRHGDVPAPDGRRRRHRNRSPGPTTGPSHCRWACARAGRCRSSTKRASCSARSPSITARRAGRATKPNCCATSATASASRCRTGSHDSSRAARNITGSWSTA